MEDKTLIKPSDVVFAVFAWLTTRKNQVTFSYKDDANIGAKLAQEFIDTNKWGDVSKKYPANFKMPKDKPDEVDLPSDVQSEMPEHAFERELCALINKYSLEETSNIPNFLLAEYLARSLTTFNHLTIKRTNFYKPPT